LELRQLKRDQQLISGKIPGREGSRANAWRRVCRLMRGRRIFLRDICLAIFYPRGRE
jgi:hypothetical protein